MPPSLRPASGSPRSKASRRCVTGEFDFIAMVRAKQHDDLADIVTRRIAQVDGVVRTHTHVAFKVYSRYDLERVFG